MLKLVFIDPRGRLRSGWRIALMLVLVLAAVTVINIGWRLAGLPRMEEGGGWWFLLFAILVSGSGLIIVRALLRRLEDTGLEGIGLVAGAPALRQLAAGTALGAVPILLLVGAALAGGYGSLAPASPGAAELAGNLLPMVFAGFLLAAWEELMLRGYLLRQFALGINAPAAAIVTGILFGLMHAGNPGANWQGLVYTALGGILMGWLVIRSGSLWLVIGYHFGWNAFSSGLFGLEVSGFEENTSLLAMRLSGPDWLTGGSYGFEASLPAVVAEVLTLGITLWLIAAGAARPARPATPTGGAGSPGYP